MYIKNTRQGSTVDMRTTKSWCKFVVKEQCKISWQKRMAKSMAKMHGKNAWPKPTGKTHSENAWRKYDVNEMLKLALRSI
jgi:hypothetical protein